jgi:hypothetical protein
MRPPTSQIIAAVLLFAVLAGLVVAIVVLTIPDGGPPTLK